MEVLRPAESAVNVHRKEDFHRRPLYKIEFITNSSLEITYVFDHLELSNKTVRDFTKFNTSVRVIIF